jgi:hypothetical protein
LIERIRAGADPQRDAAVRVQNEAVAAEVAMLRGDASAAARLAAAALSPSLRDSDKTLYTQTLLLETIALQDASAVADASAAASRLRAWAADSGDDWTKLQSALADARQAWAENRRDAALQAFAAAMQVAARLAIPDDLVAVGAAYADALIDIGHIDEARSVAGRIAPWADRDSRAAVTQVRLYRALGSGDAERNARLVAVRLVGEGKLPADAVAEIPAGAR